MREVRCAGCGEVFQTTRKLSRFCTKLCARHARLDPLIDRFMAKVDQDGPGGCWLWLGTKYVKGYGAFRSGRMMAAHRFAWVWFRGPIPDGMLVCHTCDVPACVNPDHLWLGTNQDNIDDRCRKGRSFSPRGPLAHKAKLTYRQADDVRAKALAGVKTSFLAREYGLTVSAIRRIVRGESYAPSGRDNCAS